MNKRKPIPNRRKRAQSSPKQTSPQPSKLRWLCPIICGVCAVGAVLLLAVYETTSRASTIRQTPDAKKALADDRGIVTADVAGKATEYSDGGGEPQGPMIFTDSEGGTNSGDDGSGIVSRKYDAARRLSQTTDQLGDVVDYEYDMANRLLSRTYTRNPNGPDAGQVDTDSFTYDKANRILTATSSRYDNVVSYTYDIAGRKNTESLTIGGQTYTTTLVYNTASQIVGYIYPDGTNVTRDLTLRGQLASVKVNNTDVVETYAYDSSGRVIRCELGNGVTETRSYNMDNTIKRIAFGGTGTGLGT